MTNIHACLVHEKPECVADLVANLRFLDPESLVLLYDGSPGRQVLQARAGSGVDGVIVHPDPRPMRWGRLHDFAFDALRLAMTVPEVTTLTVVDSDQLASRPGLLHLHRPRAAGDRVDGDHGERGTADRRLFHRPFQCLHGMVRSIETNKDSQAFPAPFRYSLGAVVGIPAPAIPPPRPQNGGLRPLPTPPGRGSSRTGRPGSAPGSMMIFAPDGRWRSARTAPRGTARTRDHVGMNVSRGDGTVIACEVAGEQGAAPVLMCHGLADSRLSVHFLTGWA